MAYSTRSGFEKGAAGEAIMLTSKRKDDSIISTVPERGILLKARIKHTRLFLAAFVPVVLATSPLWPEYSWPHRTMDWAGHILVPLGVSIRVFASLYVGGRKNDELVTWGPFSIVRNPLYVGSFIAAVGLALLTASIVLTTFISLAFAAYYSATVAREEVYLHRKFGVRYRQYLRSVPRWIPKLRKWDNPEELGTKPYFVLRTMIDGSLFFLCIPILEALCELRLSGLALTILTVP
ncbi:methyltransferase family protein [Planctomicrobium sp. SH668]|uniref:methyltransferase family protein n=1 Tax=Planctomicrobium sp. SH668 TaxID=3448126 RepID=UPI003F5B7440